MSIETRTAAPGPRPNLVVPEDPRPQPRPGQTRVNPHQTGWSIGDRIGLVAAWACGIALCLIAASIVLFMAWKGIQYLHLDMIFTSPEASIDQSTSGGFLDPLLGTLMLTLIGIAIAVPLGVCIAVWLTEYGRPSALARFVESGVEIGRASCRERVSNCV